MGVNVGLGGSIRPGCLLHRRPHCRRADDGYRYASISVSLRNKWASSSGSKVVAALALGREKILFVDNFSNKGLWFFADHQSLALTGVL